MNTTEWQQDTKLIHSGYTPDAATGAISLPIAQGTAFAYGSAEEIEAVFAGRQPGFIYTRIANPTVAAFESRITALENGIGSIATSSGMAAISSFGLHTPYALTPSSSTRNSSSLSSCSCR